MSWRLAAVAALALAACNLVGGIESAAPECPDDGKKNGKETDVDCGGGCSKCVNGRHCSRHEDCVDNSCYEGVCVPADCSDGRKNGTETDVDCGGENTDCDRCYGGNACEINEDCVASPQAEEKGIDACQGGRCISACCYDDCEFGCGCDDPDAPDPPSCCPKACAAKTLGTTCVESDPEPCFEPLNCFTTQGVSQCY